MDDTFALFVGIGVLSTIILSFFFLYIMNDTAALSKNLPDGARGLQLLELLQVRRQQRLRINSGCGRLPLQIHHRIPVSSTLRAV